jgi:hypothetical protein
LDNQYIRFWAFEFTTSKKAAHDSAVYGVSGEASLPSTPGALNVGAFTPEKDGTLLIALAWNSGTTDIPALFDADDLGWLTASTTTDGAGDAARIIYAAQPYKRSITPALTETADRTHEIGVIGFKFAEDGFRAWDYAPDKQQIFHNPR